MIRPRSRAGTLLAPASSLIELWDGATARAQRAGRGAPNEGDWLMSVLDMRETSVAGLVLTRIVADLNSFCTLAEKRWSAGSFRGPPDLESFARRAGAQADDLGHEYVATEHVLFALLEPGDVEIGSLWDSVPITKGRAVAEFKSLEWSAPS
jgi:hypothetical protein